MKKVENHCNRSSLEITWACDRMVNSVDLILT